MANKHDSNSEETCHLSWFMVEMDEGLAKEDKKNGRILNKSIHFMDFIDRDPTNKFVDRKVKFSYKKVIREGRVVIAAEEECTIDQIIKQIENDREVATIDHSLSKRYLVLYENGTSSFTVIIIHHNEIEWPNGEMQSYENDEPKEVLVHDGNTLRPAQVLLADKSDEIIQDKFNVLKDKVCDIIWKKSLDNVGIDQNWWLLLQFSKGLFKVTYSIVKQSDILPVPENLYPNVVAYIMETDIAIQAIILHKSPNRNELDKELRCVKELYTNL